ncbi:MAG TPA: phosphoribosylanthranilate isomerase [Steroidobacteraceae bacterium]|jgi:phosphoribosylanthranilate isomerase
MTVWVKICGLTTDVGVAAAVDSGADAIGFVFAPSKRKVTAQRAAELVRNVRGGVTRIAVMLHPSQSEVDEVLSVFRPDALQTDAEDFSGLRLPAWLHLIPVLRAGGVVPQVVPARVLFEGPSSGTGQLADWSAAQQLAGRTQLILAGGLNPGNVADAVRAVRPFGVDVSSGVESAPGLKDPDKIRDFIAAARAAQR